MYYLERKQDGTGAHGDLSIAILKGPDGQRCHLQGARPKVGVFLFVGFGSPHDRLMRWRGRITSLITRIVSETPAHVVFETESGSQYVWQYVGAELSANKAARLH